MSAEQVRYEVQLDGVDKFERGMKGMDHSANALHETMGELKKAFIGIFAVEKIIEFGKESFDAFTEANVASAQLDATLKSTNNAVGISREELDRLSESLSKNSLFADEAVTSMQSVLTTFTSIHADVFPQAQQAIADMAAKMGTDLNGTAVQVGKALQDPIRGIAALHRVGVNFSESQKQVIKSLVDTGQTAKAQQLILKELNTEFGGSAEAAKKGNPVQFMKNQMEELMERIGGSISKLIEGLMPIAEMVLNTVSGFVEAVEKSGLGSVFKHITDIALKLFGLFQKIGDVIIEAFKPLIDDIEPIFEAISENISFTIDALSNFMPVLKPIFHLIGEIAHVVIVIGLAINKALMMFINWLTHTKIFKAVWDSIVFVLEKVVGFISKIVGGIKSLLGIKDEQKQTTNPSEKLAENGALRSKEGAYGSKITGEIQPTSQADKVTGTKQVIINLNVGKMIGIEKNIVDNMNKAGNMAGEAMLKLLMGSVNQFSASTDI